MKITAPYFKGEVPRQSSRLLPDGFAAEAVNCKLTSGDLGPWRESTAVATLTPATINSIYKMQGGSNIFLRSQYDVNWAKGAIAGDTSETIYFTGFPDNPGTPTTTAPKVTTYAHATGATIHTGQTTGNYPNNWYLLGVPTPTTGPGGISQAIAAETSFSDGSSLAMWTTTGTITANENRIDATTIKMVHDSEMHADISVGNKAQDGVKFQFQVEVPKGSLLVRFGCDSLGNGPAIRINAGVVGTSSTNQINGSISFGTATTWSADPTFTKTENLAYALLMDTTQDVEISLVREPPNEFSIDPLGDFKIVVRIAGNTVVYTTTEFSTITRPRVIAIRTGANTSERLLLPGTISNQSIAIQAASSTHEINKVDPQGSYFGFKTQTYGTTIPKDIYINNVVTMFLEPTDDKVFTSYVYTWINEFGEEGPPSPASAIIEKSSGLTTTLRGIADPSAGQITDYGLSNTSLGTKRLYRAATTASGETNFFFVADIDYGTTTYVDNIADSALGETIESIYWEAPPSDAHSILSLPNGITVVASKNEIYPSVQNRPHAYPSDFALATDFDIVGLGALDTTVVVLTEANPYLVFGSDPSSLSMAKLEFQQGCVAKRSIAHIEGFGVIYASPDGLVVINGASAPVVITEQYFTRRQWQDLVPSSIKAFVHDSKYFFFYNTGSTTGGYIFDLKEKGVGLTKLDLTQQTGYDNAVTAGYSDPLTDVFYYVHSTNKLASWDTAASSLTYRWKSKVYQMPYATTMEAAQVKGSSFGSGVTFKTYADGTLFYTKTVTADGEFVLPITATNGAKELQFELTGTATITWAELAEAMEELG